MTTANKMAGIAIIGTKARGGIRAVIENHIEAGVYEGYKYYYIASHDEANALTRIGLAIQSLLKLMMLLLRGKVDICHLHGSMKGSIYRKALFIMLCRIFHCHIIFHLHGSEFAKTYNNAGSMYRRLVHFVLKQSDSVFVLSDYWKTFVTSISSNPNVQVINNFPSPQFEDLYKTREFSPKPRFQLLFLGFVGHRKGIYDLVEAVKLLKSEDIEDILIHVGGNGEIEELKKMVTDQGLSHYFNIIGWVSGGQKRELLQTSEVLLLPSHNEGLPIAILEAFSAGLPVLSTRVGGIPDAISSEGLGLLVDPGQPKEIADAIKKYLHTPGLRESIAHNARALYDTTYSADANVTRIRSVFERLQS